MEEPLKKQLTLGGVENSLDRRQKKIIDGIEKVNSSSTQDLFFLSRPFASLSLPHRVSWSKSVVSAGDGAKVESLIHHVTNGRDSLTVEGSPSFGLPYGTYPRLFHYYICSEIKRTGKAEIFLNSSLAKFMEELGFTNASTNQRNLFYGQIIRFLNANYRLEKTNSDGSKTVVMANKIVASYDIDSVWFERASAKKPKTTRIIFNDWFVEEILNSSVPFNREAILSLKGSSLAIDLYSWITWRSHTLNKSTKKRAVIKLADFEKQLGLSYGRPRDLRRDLEKAYNEVLALYPQAKMVIAADSITLHSSSEAISQKDKP